MRFSETQLRDKALQALEEIVKECRHKPMPDTAMHRFLFRYLASISPEVWPLTSLWNAMVRRDVEDFGRNQTITASLNGVYLQVGLVRP